MRVLITGANGFLGRAVAAGSRDGASTIALVRTKTSVANPLFDIVYDSVDELIAEVAHVDAVLHLAACIPANRASAPQELISVNVDLPRRLIHAYPTARHVHASSVSVFGAPHHLPLTMASAPNNTDPYGLSKLAAEKLIEASPRHAIIRFSSIIGVNMKPGTFIPSAVAGARAGHIRLFGNGDRLQNYIDVEDAAVMCWKAIERTDSFATLGIGTRSYTNNEIAELLAHITNASIIRKGIDPSPSYSYELGNSVNLGPTKIAIEQTLKKMIQA